MVDRATLLREYDALVGSGAGEQQAVTILVQRYKFKRREGVRGMLSKARADKRIEALETEVADLKARLAGGMYEAMPARWDDTPKLRRYLDTCNTGEYRRVLCWPDIHFPDDCQQAIALGGQLESVVNPDLNMLMGDVLDLDALGKFSQNRRRKRTDALEEAAAPYHRFIAQRKAPVAVIMGNHDSPTAGRMGRVLDELYTPLSVTIEEAYIDLLRAGGKVWYLGGMNEVKLHSVVLQHGTRTGENAARNALKDRGYGMANVGVHTHFPSLSILSQDIPGDDGAYRIIMSAVLGTLSNLKPHYQQGTRKTRHIHAMGVVTFSLKTWVADVQLVVFHPTPNGDLVAFYGGHVLTQPREVARVIKQAA